MKADSAVIRQHTQRKISFCMRMKNSFSEENFSKKRMGCIPGEANSPWTKAGRQKGQQAQDRRSDEARVDHVGWSSRKHSEKGGLGQAASKVGLQRSDIKSSQF